MAKKKRSEPAGRRSYQQSCGVARALDVVGERWTLLVVRNLLLGPRRYSDLLDELPGITTNLLAKRLRDMEAAGLLARRVDQGYDLTARGAALEPVVMELGRWGMPMLRHPRPGDRSDVALGLLSLKRRYAGGLKLTVGLIAGGRAFTLMATPSSLIIRDEPAQRPDVVVAGALPAVRALIFGGHWADGLAHGAELEVSGDEAGWAAFRAAFRLNPGPAA